MERFPVHIGHDAIERLVDFCQDKGMNQLTLVADDNTYPALGERVEQALTAQGCDVLNVVLDGEEIIADARYVFRVMREIDTRERVYLAVGSGTLTDISRFVSHRSRVPFISLPTAPSVDGFTSIGAPMVIDQAKVTVLAQAPIGVFADLPTLCAAPQPMIAAGFGDLVGKYTSTGDWRLGHLLWDEPYDEAIARRSIRAAQASHALAGEIGKAEEDGVRSLIDGLIESGFCMLDFGETRPASGAEHQASHVWEMKLLRENRPAILHGAKVGVACVYVAANWDQVKSLSQQEATERLTKTAKPDPQQDIKRIRESFGPLADTVIEIQSPFLNMTNDDYTALQRKIVDNWAVIQEIAADVPSQAEFVDMLLKAGAPIDASELGLGEDEVRLGIETGHFYRNRFNITKLSRMLGLAP